MTRKDAVCSTNMPEKPNSRSRASRKTLAALLVSFLLLVDEALAEEPSQEWDFYGEAYFWAATLEAETTDGEDVDVSFSDILEHLNYGAMGAVGAEKGRWIIAADGIYLNLESDESSQQSIGGTLTRLDADVDIQGFISTAAVGYDLLDSDNTTLHLLGGGRYLWLDFDLDVEAGSGGVDFSDSNSWVDGIVGLRGRTQVADGWHLVYHGDIGTGESDLTWQLLGAVNYRFRNVDLVLGYRYLGWNFDAGENDVLDELSIHGPMAGVKFSF